MRDPARHVARRLGDGDLRHPGLSAGRSAAARTRPTTASVSRPEPAVRAALVGFLEFELDVVVGSRGHLARLGSDRVSALVRRRLRCTGRARSASRSSKELLTRVWHPDGTANFIGSYEGTVAGFVERVWSLHEPLVAHSHQMTNILIKVDGDTAVSETYVMTSLHAQPTEESATTRLARGRYADTWSKHGGRWAIDERTYIPDLRTFHDATGPNQPTAGRRDRTDPSYRVYPY